MESVGSLSVAAVPGLNRAQQRALKRARQKRELQLGVVNVPGVLLTIDIVEAMVGRSRSSIYKLLAEGAFPPPVRLSTRRVRWKSDVIRDYLAAL